MSKHSNEMTEETILEGEFSENKSLVSKDDFMPMLTANEALDRYNQLKEIVEKVLVEGRDFGAIPGTSKPTLLKAGAEKLTTFFGLSPKFIPLESVQDWTGEDHDSEPFFNYRYKCQLWRGDLLIGEGVGSCNSWEAKYRFRYANYICPHCGKDTIIKGKEEFGGGWLCWTKKGGCNAKFSDEDEQITGQEVGQIKNENPADIVNTIDKMAQKRALVAAALVACNASDFFTQDIEDMPITQISTEPQKKKKIIWTKEQLEILVGEKIVPDVEMAEAILGRSCLSSDVPNEHVIRWGQNYMAHIDTSKSPKEAASLADKAYQNWKKREGK